MIGDKMKKTNENFLFNWSISFLFLAMFASIIHSTSIITVSNYTITPYSVTPGTTGFATIILSNEGDTIAEDITLHYGLLDQTPWTGASIPVGDIPSKSSTTVVIPFKVPSTYNSGIASLPVMVFYGSSESANFVIPIRVQFSPNLIVKLLNNDTIFGVSGESFNLVLNISNIGGSIKDFSITISNNSVFKFDKVSKYYYGNLDGNTSILVTIPVFIDPKTSSGTFNLPIELNYLDGLQGSVSQSSEVGPIFISDFSSLLRVNVTQLNPAYPGSILNLNITITNMGSNIREGSIELSSTSYLIPKGSSSVYFDRLDINSTRSQVMSIGISPSISLGYYTLPLTVKLNDGRSFNTTVGIQIESESELKIDYSTTPSSLAPGTTADLSLDISNVGDSGIRSATISLYSDELKLTKLNGFLGTINVDETSVFTTTFTVPFNVSPGAKDILITVKFKDGANQEHTLSKKISLEIGNNRTINSNNSPTYGTQFPTNPSTRNSSNNILYWIIGAIVFVATAYFLYRWWRGKKKHVEQKEKRV